MSRKQIAALDALPYPLVLIEWVDSSHVGNGWTSFDDLGHGDDHLTCLSVGFVIRENRASKLLVPNVADIWQPDNLQAHGCILIPKRAIISERVIHAAR